MGRVEVREANFRLIWMKVRIRREMQVMISDCDPGSEMSEEGRGKLLSNAKGIF